MKEPEIALIPIGKIKPNPKNPRLIKDKRFQDLVESIKTFPEMLKMRPLIVDEAMIILGGNMRLKACKELKMKKLYFQMFTREQADAMNLALGTPEKTYEEYCQEFVIKDNSSFGEWDWEILMNDSDWNFDNLDAWGVDTPDFGEKEESDNEDEWVGMPEFAEIQAPHKIVISFENEEDRKKFDLEYKLSYVKKESKTWSCWWPFKERDDLASLKYD